MPCPKCNGRLAWKERSWTAAGEDPGHWSCMMCGEVVYPERAGLPRVPQNIESPDFHDEELMSYHLDSKKEEEIKILLRTASIREIVAKTGVAKNTILRIRNENFTEEERATLKKSSLIKGRNKRELETEGPKTDLQNDSKNIPSTAYDGKGGQEIMTEQTQVCTNPKCPKPNPQPISEFNKNAARPSGHESRCGTCTAQAQRDRRAAIEKASAGGTGRSRKAPGNGGRKRKPRGPEPVRVPRIDLDQQLALDLKTIKKRVAAEVLQIYHEGGQRAVEEAFA